MVFHLIAMVSAGFAAAGVYLVARRLLGERLPRWAMPAAIGAAMIGFTIWSEYSWAARTLATLPDGVKVTFRDARSDFWRPWTYVFPVTGRMAAIDTDVEGALPPDAPEGARLAHVYLMERWGRSLRVAAVFDCAGGRLRAISEEAGGAAGWSDLPSDDPAFGAVCGGG